MLICPTTPKPTLVDFERKPSDYPLSPFKMRFDPPLFHPNSKHRRLFGLSDPNDRQTRAPSHCDLVYADGNVCISILHTPGDDPTMYEQASERWSPVQSVEKVILSVISMLAGERASTFNSMASIYKSSRLSSHHLHLHFATSLLSPTSSTSYSENEV